MMAVISLDYNDLVSLLGQKVSKEDIVAKLPMLGSDVESVEGDTLNVEFFANRPDLYSVEGVARALRGFLGFEKGLVSYPVGKSNVVLTVDPSVVDVRPFIAAGMVKGVEMTDELIKSLMDVQEKLHLTLGRNRKKVAIGVHDSRSLKPPFVYKAVAPDSMKFIPLGHYEEMSMSEILAKHEKGREYAWILEGMKKYPIILDSANQVLSFPPIINGTVTQVTEATTDIFLDLTGTDINAANSALNIISTMLAERGGRIETVDVVYADKTLTLPDLKPKNRKITSREVNALLGTGYGEKQIIEFLGKMRFGAKLAGNDIEVEIPAYRNDVLHNVDIIEDVAIGAGYSNIKGVLPRALTFGKELAIEKFTNQIRELMIGYGFFEIKSLTLSSEKDQFEMLLRPEDKNLVKILNPISTDLTCARVSLTPSMFRFLQANKHRDLPQQVFEAGDILAGEETKRRLAIVTLDPKASFTEMKSLVQSLMRDLGKDVGFSNTNDPAYIPGRGADVLVDSVTLGSLGEYSPKVIENFELGYPAAGFEISLEGI
jgi:phenylalanyl-tRNA synthetase beta chain